MNADKRGSDRDAEPRAISEGCCHSSWAQQPVATAPVPAPGASYQLAL